MTTQPADEPPQPVAPARLVARAYSVVFLDSPDGVAHPVQTYTAALRFIAGARNLAADVLLSIYDPTDEGFLVWPQYSGFFVQPEADPLAAIFTLPIEPQLTTLAA